MAEAKKKKIKLTAIREAFCQHYTKHWNATRAAKEAGYRGLNHDILGYQLLQKTLVKERIAELTEHALIEIGISRERVLTELARIAFVDPADAYDEIGQLLPIREMPEDVRRSVSKIKVFEHKDGQGENADVYGFTKDIEFAQKKGALDTLAKHLGLAPDKHELSGPNGKPIETKNTGHVSDEQLDAKINEYLSKLGGKSNE